MKVYSLDFFLNLELVCCSMSGSNCCFLACIQVSQETDKVVWYSHLFNKGPQFVVIHTVNICWSIFCGKFLKRWVYQTTLSVSWEICIRVKKQQLELEMELTGSKLGKKYDKALYCHPAYLTSMQNTSCEMLGWMNHKQESRLPGEISITSDMQITAPFLQKVKRN